ncbi:methyltransferase, putative [Plasmodium gaboni]|uniref:tRNA N(3)-methylcytidine methyltransferase n=1 Tax=Plasmodium gaboni TaxID=647221 RepID=A0ABY1UR59_9APIC|nr:methyltransferase, putative [Plasmodium gaboni]
MRAFFDSDIVINFTLSEEAIEKEKSIIENNKRLVRDCQREKLLCDVKKNWDKFYNQYKTNFFKDRKWLKVEFDHIFKEGLKNYDENVEESEIKKDDQTKLVLEIGCGVGNSLIPLLMEYEHCNFIGIDFSKHAINFLNDKWQKILSMNNKLKVENMNVESNMKDEYEKEIKNKNILSENNIKDGYQNDDNNNNNNNNDDDNNNNDHNNNNDCFILEEQNCSDIFELKSYKKLGNLIKTCVVDITSSDDDNSNFICEYGSVDIILLIYVLSAVQPDKMINVINNSYKYLKKGGYVLLRDYGLYDLTQVRFAIKKEKNISENFYVRGDKTFVYFFKTEELHDLFCNNGKFEEIQNKYITRIVKNRKRNLEMKRIWVQSIFRKI